MSRPATRAQFAHRREIHDGADALVSGGELGRRKPGPKPKPADQLSSRRPYSVRLEPEQGEELLQRNKSGALQAWLKRQLP